MKNHNFLFCIFDSYKIISRYLRRSDRFKKRLVFMSVNLNLGTRGFYSRAA